MPPLRIRPEYHERRVRLVCEADAVLRGCASHVERGPSCSRCAYPRPGVSDLHMLDSRIGDDTPLHLDTAREPIRTRFDAQKELSRSDGS